jgi:hypothetical protein
MVTLPKIRDAIVDEKIPLRSILRQAHILAYQLENNSFKHWVNYELNGYPNDFEDFDELWNSLPSYRKLDAEIRANGIQGFYKFTNMPVVAEFIPKEKQTLWFTEGIPSIEKLLDVQGTMVQKSWHPSDVAFFNDVWHKHMDTRLSCFEIWVQAPATVVTNIIETVRDSLLAFVLELQQIYPSDNSIAYTQDKQHEVSHLVQTFILHGGNIQMATFDQRQQQVQGSQYNAARDINFGEVKTREDFLVALNDLHRQAEGIQPTNDDETEIAIDIKSNLEKAIAESKKDNPDKGKIRKFLDKASDFAKTTAAFAGMVTIFHKAVEALQALPF